MITNVKWLGLLAVAFVAGSFVASPELRAYAANTVFSTDIVDGEVKTADLANNAVTAAKIKDAEVKAAEIATDAVGAAEIQGVTKLLFGQCDADSTEANTGVLSSFNLRVQCTINGVADGDSALAVRNSGSNCFEIETVETTTNIVQITLFNDCAQTTKLGPAAFSLVVFDK